MANSAQPNCRMEEEALQHWPLRFAGNVCLLTLAFASLACRADGQQGYETHTPFPQPVLNAPYTAQRVTTTYQKLADGTQIKHERVVLQARDTIGRTWSQFDVENNDALRRDGKKYTAWTIWDPATRTMVDGCDCNHVAWVRHYDSPLPSGAIRNGPPPGTSVLLGPANGLRQYVSEPLPPQDILGMPTQGTKATRTVPAGKDGNDHDLTWTVLSWYSPELQLALTTIVDDPIKGTTKYEFRDLRRGEPDTMIFQIPGGYIRKDALPLRDNPANVPGSSEFR